MDLIHKLRVMKDTLAREIEAAKKAGGARTTNGQKSLSVWEGKTQEPPVVVQQGWGKTPKIVVTVLAVLTLLFGGLWIASLTGTDYKVLLNAKNLEYDRLETELETARQANNLLKERLGEPLDVGFEVQIGAFEHYNLRAADEELVRMTQVSEIGLNKFILGRFAYLQDAETFLKDLQNMGLNDAFIAGVVDGKRAPLEEAIAASKEFYGF